MPTTIPHIRHLPKAILYCLLTTPCHAAQDTGTIQLTIYNRKKKTTFSIDIPDSATVQDLKQKIKDQKSIPRAAQTLLFLGKQLDNHRKLYTYNIANQSTIYLIQQNTYTFPLRIEHGSNTFDITAQNRTGTIAIKYAIRNAKGYPINTQTLLQNGNQLQDMTKLETYGIHEDNATLQLALAPNTPNSDNSNHSPNHDNNNHDATSSHDNTILNNPNNNNPNHDTTNQNNNPNNNENQDKDNTTTYIMALCILFILSLAYVVKQNPVKKDPKSQDTTAPPTSPPPTPRKPKKAPLNIQA